MCFPTWWMPGSQFIRFLGLPAQGAAEEMLEFPQPMKGGPHTCCTSPFCSRLLLLQPCLYTSISGRSKTKDLRDLQHLAGGLEERFLQPWCVQVSVLPCQGNGILPHQGEGMGSSKQEGACCACQLYFSVSFMHWWVWGCTSGLYLPLFYAPKNVCSTCPIVLWMWPYGWIKKIWCRALPFSIRPAFSEFMLWSLKR